ncbi:CDP-alcohol phosphatidyltransferase family protein [Rhodobacteraceae bacterium D3-12]|nr:CDP-alcohol phosphatidyltransferase family protein [Rhodobacteraceae bacterium D3-12]
MSDPDTPPGKRAPLRAVQLLPNLLTLGALCAGLSAIRFAVHGNLTLAVALIALAALLDGLDGAMARLLKSESAMGAELDSLADFLNFGVAPALMLYLWALPDSRSGGWIAALIYAICCALRLARYNVGDKAAAGKKSAWFQGVPAPGAALLALLPLVMFQVMPGVVTPILPFFTGLWLVIVGLLMIARNPTPSFKLLRISRDKAPFFMVALMGIAATAFTWPWPVLLVAQIAYLFILARFALKPPQLIAKDND